MTDIPPEALAEILRLLERGVKADLMDAGITEEELAKLETDIKSGLVSEDIIAGISVINISTEMVYEKATAFERDVLVQALEIRLKYIKHLISKDKKADLHV